MLRLNFEPASAAFELARDEAMLLWADSIVESRLGGDHSSQSASSVATTELIRTWSFVRPTVVLGRSSKIDEEVDRRFCLSRSIEVLRRCTGGASVVGGPGCLMYSVVIATPGDGELRKIDVAHDYVMTRVLAAVQDQLPEAKRLGICDLTLDDKKFSGNSLRVTRHHLLYHGTILIASNLDLFARCLAYAPRQPQYRRGRNHGDFITNVDLDQTRLIESLGRTFAAEQCADARLSNEISIIADGLFASRYADASWHQKR